MINKQEYQELYNKWCTVGPCYQEYRRVGYRLEHFLEHCSPYLRSRDVVEFGCNAGAFGVEIFRRTNSYIGVEPGNKVRDPKKRGKPKTDYAKQGQITVEHVADHNFRIYNDTIAEFCERNENFDVFVAAFAMYHFRDFELDLMKKKIFPKCEVVLIQNRVQKRPTKHNSYKFWKTKNIEKFFEELGYKISTVHAHNKDKGVIFDEVIGVR